MEQNIKVQNHRAIMYTVSNHQRTVKKENLAHRHNPQQRFTDKVAAKITEIVETWANIVETANSMGKKVELSFITLTIPTKQVNCDKTIVSSCLLPFLKSLGNYLYVVEKQENGNIHFHCITDTSLVAKELRKKWNEKLELLQYITAYQSEKKEIYKYGFIVVDNGFSVVQQQLWYSFGQMTNWTNPRTLDKREIKDSSKVASYITKYMTKGTKSLLCCNRWGGTVDIKKLCSPKLKRHQYHNEDIEELYSIASNVVSPNEYVTVIKCANLLRVLDKNTLLMANVHQYQITQANFIY